MIQEMRFDVERLALPAGRVVGQPEHDRAREYLGERLAGLGLAPYLEGGFEAPYEDDGVAFTNLLATLPGADPLLAPVLIGAHYDTCGPQPGADDNAAAVAVLLAAAAELKKRSRPRSILFALFDAEEPPYFLSSAMGSVAFYERQRKGPIHCALIMDLVGHDVPVPGLEDLLAITGTESDPGLQEVLSAVQGAEGLRLVPVLNRYVGDMSDHHAFREDGRPYLFLSCGRWEHYHQVTDTPDRLNYLKMAHIQSLLVALCERIAARPLNGPFEGEDPVALEARFLSAAFGPFLAAFGMELDSRADIDLFVSRFQSMFGL